MLANEIRNILSSAIARGEMLRDTGPVHPNDAATFPCFFTVSSEPSLDVRAEPSVAAPLVRSLPLGTVVFVLARCPVEDSADSAWLQIHDGYVRECSIMFTVRGPRAIETFSPTQHMPEAQRREVEARRLAALENILPQPAAAAAAAATPPSAVAAEPEGAGAGAEAEPPREKSLLERHSNAARESGASHGLGAATAEEAAKLAAATLAAAAAAAAAPAAPARAKDAAPATGSAPRSAPTAAPGTGTGGVSSAFMASGEEALAAITRATSEANKAAEMMQSTFGDSLQRAYDKEARRVIRTTEHWGVGTSLDRMVAVQEQMERFASSLEMMHDTVSTCKVRLGNDRRPYRPSADSIIYTHLTWVHYCLVGYPRASGERPGGAVQSDPRPAANPHRGAAAGPREDR